MAREFLEVIDAERAHERFRNAMGDAALGTETVKLEESLGRVLATDIVSPTDVPGFDRSNVDGYAVQAADTFGASESDPRVLTLNDESIEPGVQPKLEVQGGTATYVATGGMIPRGADAVVMVEHADRDSDKIAVQRASTPGQFIAFAGSDIPRGQNVLCSSTVLTARETGTIAALGLAKVEVFRRPRVALFSTGNEIVEPGGAYREGLVYDTNLRIIADTLLELGCEPFDLGIVRDETNELRAKLDAALDYDAVLFSGGTSKGEGDLSADIVRERARVLCHGVAVRPGKPICIAVTDQRQPVVVLPGFPTSAVFTFHEFVAPVLARLAGRASAASPTVRARLPLRLNSDRGRTDFVLVGLTRGPEGLSAYPMGKGSGSVTTYSRADGFITIDRLQEWVEAGEEVEVKLLGREVEPADLVVIGSHCVGLDALLSALARRGYTIRSLPVGSQSGFDAAHRGECDLAGVHLCDSGGTYNTPFLESGVTLSRGYGRMQGIVFRRQDGEPDLFGARMVNRNRGSGTRVLIDELLGEQRPPGFHFEARSHNAVAVAVGQKRADWGVAIESVAKQYDLGFKPLREERYDFVIPESRRERAAVRAFCELLESDEGRTLLEQLGFSCS